MNNSVNNNVDKWRHYIQYMAAFILGMASIVATMAMIDYLSTGQVTNPMVIPPVSVQTVADTVSQSSPWIGIEVREIDETIAQSLGLPNLKGVYVSKVIEDSPADKGGIEIGDVIIRFNRQSIEDTPDLKNFLSTLSPGTRVQVVLIRGDERKSLYVKIEVSP